MTIVETLLIYNDMCQNDLTGHQLMGNDQNVMPAEN